MTDQNFSTICLCAMRYALGRETYMPGIVQRFIRAHIGEIDDGTIRVMIRDIDEADWMEPHNEPDGRVMFVSDGLGDSKIDRPGWEQLREFLKGKVKKDDMGQDG